MTFPLHSEDATDTVEHGTDPATIVIAANHIQGADLASGRVELVDEREHPLLMRHRDQNAREISRRPRPSDESQQVVCLHEARDANGVYILLGEEPIEELGRLGRREGIPYQRVESCCSGDVRGKRHLRRAMLTEVSLCNYYWNNCSSRNSVH